MVCTIDAAATILFPQLEFQDRNTNNTRKFNQIKQGNLWLGDSIEGDKREDSEINNCFAYDDEIMCLPPIVKPKSLFSLIVRFSYSGHDTVEKNARHATLQSGEYAPNMNLTQTASFLANAIKKMAAR